MHAPARRNVGQPKCKWLRDDGDGDWGMKNGKSINIPTSGGSGASTVGEEIIKGRDLRIYISRGKNQFQNSNALFLSGEVKQNDGPGEDE